MKPKKLFITGGAGYVGAMLIEQFSARPDVEAIFAIDKVEMPDLIKGNKKLTWVTANTADDTWQEKARAFAPDVVIHTAWQIREMYGKKALQWKWNIDGSDKVFDFAFSTSSVAKIIHFSTVASYGAFKDNSLEHRFKESEPFRDTEYLYATEKKVAEEHLLARYNEAKKKGKVPQVFIVRPAAITGPRGRFMRVRFGLQAALAGQLRESFIHRVISLMVSFVPTTKTWCRQFIHEDDVNDIIALLTFQDLKGEYEAFNICPPGPVVLAKDMAQAVGKRTIPIHPRLIQFAFFFMWHISRGRVPTSRGGWKSYSYPIAVDGSKLTTMYGYQYRWPSKEAFVKKEGRYAKYI